MTDLHADPAEAPAGDRNDDPSRRQSPARSRRPFLWPGVGLILIGLGLVAYVAWELWVTDIIAAGRQEKNIAAIEYAWSQGDDIATTEFGQVGAQLRVPRWGADYTQPILEGTTATQLNAGVGHFEQAVAVGKVGNYAIAGHRTTYGKPFARFPELQVGDEIEITTRDATFVYLLISDGDSLTVDPSEVWVADPIPRNPSGGLQPPQAEGQRLLTMSTCSGIFGFDARKIVWGELNRIEYVDGRVKQFTSPVGSIV
ncbi:MAG: class E sortase [Nocardioides sp.]